MSTDTVSHRVDVLGCVPLFADWEPAELEETAKRCSERTYLKGEVVWRAGDAGDDLLIVVSGELAVWGTDEEGDEQLIARVGPGECVGEMALLLGEYRSATVTCTRSVVVLALAEPDFRDLVRNDARALARMSQLLSRRVASLAHRHAVHSPTTVGAVVAAPGVPGASLVAAALAAFVGERLGRQVLLVRVRRNGVPARDVGPHSVAGRFLTERVAVVDVAMGDPLLEHHLAAMLDLVVSSIGSLVPVVIFDLQQHPAADVVSASASCDTVVEVVATPDAPRALPRGGTSVLRVVNLYGEGNGDGPLRVPISGCDPFVLRVDGALVGRPVEEQVDRLVSEPQAPASIVLRRLAHKVLGVSVGLAMGGGAALGIAHIGVLKALEDGGVPVDMVVGSSMGAVVSVGYAAGITPDTMEDMTRRVGTVRTTLSLLKPALDGTGLLAGSRITKILGPLLPEGVETFADFVRPCRVLATDIESGERVTFEEGSVELAIRASCAIPLIFTPVRVGDRTLVDGAVVDPVPADVARDMGADVVIGVNVFPPLELGTSTRLSRVFHNVNRLNPIAYLHGMQSAPNILDVIMNTVQLLESELGSFKSLCADVSLNVDLGGFSWVEFYRGLEIMERGRLEGQRSLPEVRAALHRRLERYGAAVPA